MKKKHIMLGIIIVLIIIILCIVGFLNSTPKNDYEDLQDYTPQEEISDEQLRKTIVSLYFKSKEKNELISEARLIDSKLLLHNPYSFLLSLLIQGPQNTNADAIIPNNTIINNVYLNGDVLELDLSDAFINDFNGDDEQKKLAIYSILNTLTQLNEVNGIHILINGEANMSFKDSEIKLDEVYRL